MNKWKVFLAMILGMFLLIGSNMLVSADVDPQPRMESSLAAVEGQLSVIWGDPMPGSQQETVTRYYLTDDYGNKYELQFAPDTVDFSNILTWRDQRVQVSGQQLFETDHFDIHVEQINLENVQAENSPQLVGSQPWISILCKFSDFPDEPENLAFFQGMYSATYPGLNHYWQEQSYGLINLNGSGAAGWFDLPRPESYYNPSDTMGGTDLDLLASDCIGVADASINFAPFSGINMMFNTNFDNGFAWGGYSTFTLDGVYKRWRLTWEPPWGYRNIAVIAHETGHGFGLPHSSGNYGLVYDNFWDVMSSTWYNNLIHPTYGFVGQHTIAYHKDILDWISPGQKFIPSTNSRTTITLERLAQPQTGNYKLAKIPVDGSSTHFYTVEARRLVGYDAALPGDAVIIHEVNTYRNPPARVIDIDGDGDTSDAGARWMAGETFTDAANQISVSVNSATSSGYVVTIQLGNPAPLPGSFGKLSPSNGAGNQPLSVTLSWSGSTGASGYEYCYDTTNDNACSNWMANGTGTSVVVSGLAENTSYYWQVRAENSGGTTYANGSATAYWSFTTLLYPPQAFNKLSPVNGANSQLTNLRLSWQSSSNAASYAYCYDTTNDNACSNWASAGSSTSAWVTGLNTNTTYYWHVRALNSQGLTYSNGSTTAFWSFTTAPIIYEIFLPLVKR